MALSFSFCGPGKFYFYLVKLVFYPKFPALFGHNLSNIHVIKENKVFAGPLQVELIKTSACLGMSLLRLVGEGDISGSSLHVFLFGTARLLLFSAGKKKLVNNFGIVNKKR